MHAQVFAQPMNGQIVSWMRQQASQRSIILAGGVFIKENDDRCVNRLVWMLPNGQCHWYDKRHLFSFGNENENYQPGNRRVIVQANGLRFCLQICYDLRFPVWSRQQVVDGEPEYDVLVYVANWPAVRQHAWRSLLMARAIENQCYVLGVNRVGPDGNDIDHNGQSCIVDPLGELMWMGSSTADVGHILLDKEALNAVRRRFPFLRDADAFSLHP
jgi:predicted amidohydrolase